MPVDRTTRPLAVVDARGRRSLVERMVFGGHESVAQNSRWHQQVPGPQLPGMVSTVTFVVGVWLVVGPLVRSDIGFDGGRAGVHLDLVVGTALATLGMLRLTRPIRVVHATAAGTVLGATLVVAPLIVEYGLQANSTLAVVNDLLTGLIVVAVTVVGFADARRRGGFDV